jgi:hypothetical protein
MTSPTPGDDDAERPVASLAVDGTLRCFVDQLPLDRCIACNKPAESRPYLIDRGKRRATLALCNEHRPKPLIPAVLGLVLTASSTGFLILNGLEGLVQTVAGYLFAVACFAIALQRRSARVGFANGQLELRDVAAPVVKEVMALGAGPHPTVPVARALAAPRT